MSLQHISERTQERPRVEPYRDHCSNVMFRDWGRMAYGPALAKMEYSQTQRIQELIPDVFCFVEHDPVVTYGRATPPEHLPAPESELPLHEVPRGGLATYHGPGQLVGYGILDLRKRNHSLRPDIHQYLRALERALIDFLAVEFKLNAFRVSGETGVWIHDSTGSRKIASIGVSARRWITAHGFALNVDTDLQAFGKFVPCGIEHCEMTSIEREMTRNGWKTGVPAVSEVALRLQPYLRASLEAYAQGTVN